ncbi:hypothetical protein TWF106_008110 [Orbilia oligospora]|uniref:BTB domain-containing protein n=1 Tax=Orbilia oligospora TaxID=2813651 RepID=A0A6G1LZT6_ORBOL|nr:hypothetical protein TWF191_000709 [Orbilia oligospora]KAF3214885.1 hypothetical protein TWF679_004663 [Orbilia oligospora]KAF3217061.1 hypothetical protein TWF106_008110 [Orbilia oligospora]KAF3239075.1 hypothetical protein TWF192_010153 [Orbilia oligospora]
MTESFSTGPWPLGFDTGADSQLRFQDYCQPPAWPTPPEKYEGNNSDGAKQKPEEKNGEDETQPEALYKQKALQRISNRPIYYEAADLKVVLKNESGNFSFLVSSHALSISSKVWKLIIHPRGTKELDTENLVPYGAVKIMKLEDDDALTLDVIFQIIHLQTDEIPAEISFGLLRKIAIVSDKYECGKVLNPWPKLWMKPYENRATAPLFEDWIFIAKALNSKNTKAKAISKELILEVSSKSQCDNYFWRMIPTSTDPVSSKVEIHLKHLPDGLLVYVMRERLRAIKAIVTMLRQFTSDISSAKKPLSISSASYCKDACSDVAVGSLIRNLKLAGLWPLLSSATPHEWHGSVRTLVKKIEGLKMTTVIETPDPKPEPSTSLGARTAPSNNIFTNPRAGSLFGTATTVANNNPVNLFASTATSSPSTGSSLFGSTNPMPPATSNAPFGRAATNAPTASSSLFGSGGGVLTPTISGASSSTLTAAGPAIASTSLAEHKKNTLSFYEYPAFTTTSYTSGHKPCHKAFALGDLITKCQRIIKDISAGGYDEGV